MSIFLVAQSSIRECYCILDQSFSILTDSLFCLAGCQDRQLSFQSDLMIPIRWKHDIVLVFHRHRLIRSIHYFLRRSASGIAFRGLLRSPLCVPTQ